MAPSDENVNIKAIKAFEKALSSFFFQHSQRLPNRIDRISYIFEFIVDSDLEDFFQDDEHKKFRVDPKEFGNFFRSIKFQKEILRSLSFSNKRFLNFKPNKQEFLDYFTEYFIAFFEFFRGKLKSLSRDDIEEKVERLYNTYTYPGNPSNPSEKFVKIFETQMSKVVDKKSLETAANYINDIEGFSIQNINMELIEEENCVQAAIAYFRASKRYKPSDKFEEDFSNAFGSIFIKAVMEDIINFASDS